MPTKAVAVGRKLKMLETAGQMQMIAQTRMVLTTNQMPMSIAEAARIVQRQVEKLAAARMH
jgi:hypothetical protein